MDEAGKSWSKNKIRKIAKMFCVAVVRIALSEAATIIHFKNIQIHNGSR